MTHHFFLQTSSATRATFGIRQRVWPIVVSAAGSRKGIELFLDQAAMNDAERWIEISEVMSFDVQAVDVATTESTEITAVEEVAAIEAAEIDAAVTIEAAPEMIEIHEPRTPRVVSISELRQRLGIEQAPLARSAPLPTTVRPRIVSRRREAEEYAELAAG